MDNVYIQQLQDYLDDFTTIKGITNYEESVLNLNVTSRTISIACISSEKVINFLKPYHCVDNLLIGKRFDLTEEGITLMLNTYQDLFKELMFYTDFDDYELYQLSI